MEIVIAVLIALVVLAVLAVLGSGAVARAGSGWRGRADANERPQQAPRSAACAGRDPRHRRGRGRGQALDLRIGSNAVVGFSLNKRGFLGVADARAPALVAGHRARPGDAAVTQLAAALGQGDEVMEEAAASGDRDVIGGAATTHGGYEARGPSRTSSCRSRPSAGSAGSEITGRRPSATAPPRRCRCRLTTPCGSSAETLNVPAAAKQFGARRPVRALRERRWRSSACWSGLAR